MQWERVGLGHRKGAHGLTPTCTEEMQMSPGQQADAFLRSVGAPEEGGNELGIEGGMREMSMTPSPNIPQPPPPPQVSPNPNFTLPESCEERGILAEGRERSIHDIERRVGLMSITPSPTHRILHLLRPRTRP